MGTISKGILGGFSGKVGNVSGANWNGIDVIRSLPGKRKRIASSAQLIQQARFKIAVALVRSFGSLWSTGFNLRAVRMSAKNRAVRYMLNNVITGTYPDLSIDFSKVLISAGDLPNAIAVKAMAQANGMVEFSWTDNAGTAGARADDVSLVALYDAASGHTVYATAGASRGAGKAVLDGHNLSGATVHTWLGFVSSDGSKIANSMYTGEVTIAV